MNTRHAERVTAKELSLKLSTSFASHRQHQNQRKAITLINPDSAYLLALIETVGWHHVRALRNVLVQYVMSKTNIDIYVMNTGFATFQLEFHLPYLTLTSTGDLPSFPTVALISSGLREAQISLSVVGVSDTIWTSYCLVHVSDDEIDLIADEDSSDSGYDDGDSVFYNHNNHSESVSDVPTPDDRYKDPRKYWLEVVTIRMQIIAGEWRWLVRSTECTLQNIPPLGRSPKDLEQISDLLCLLDKLLTNLTSTTQAFSRFMDTDGVIAYLKDLNDTKTRSTMERLKEMFDRLLSLEESLHGMKKTCEMKFKIVDSTLIHANNRARLYVDRELNDLRLEMTKLNRTSTSAAVETSRLTRTNVHVFLIVTPFVLTLQYFSGENEIFSFDRSPSTFSYSVMILLCLLLALTYGVGLIDNFWGATRRRLSSEKPRESEKYVNV
ncbi:hypothetical protein B5807_10526 [Epicoccum nigrum]|uniref:Uncharacterized protein n=1 Tax=Epicoccum nigrum TaxID=105696 RepID=A0A1Y2LLC6_EPING|nr:hypothetical protein B5807_10526 [Epicoccum nigrum]